MSPAPEHSLGFPRSPSRWRNGDHVVGRIPQRGEERQFRADHDGHLCAVLPRTIDCDGLCLFESLQTDTDRSGSNTGMNEDAVVRRVEQFPDRNGRARFERGRDKRELVIVDIESGPGRRCTTLIMNEIREQDRVQ